MHDRRNISHKKSFNEIISFVIWICSAMIPSITWQDVFSRHGGRDGRRLEVGKGRDGRRLNRNKQANKQHCRQIDIYTDTNTKC